MELSRHGAPRSGVRVNHLLVRVEDARRLSHEVYAAEDNNVRVDALGLPAELQAVTDEVRDLLYLWRLIVVGEEDGALLPQRLLNLNLKRLNIRRVQPLVPPVNLISSFTSRARTECVRHPRDTTSTPAAA